MDMREFERALFEYLERKSLVLTPVNVGFALNVDVQRAAELLAALADEGLLELVSGSGAGATYRRPGKPTHEPTPGLESHGEPISERAINRMALDLQVPGLGSLVTLSPLGCLPVLGLFGLAVFLGIYLDGWSKLWAAVPVLAGCAWSIVFSIFGYMADDRSQKKHYLQ